MPTKATLARGAKMANIKVWKQYLPRRRKSK